MGRVAALLVAVLALAGATVGCGGDDGDETDAPQGATLALDFAPSAAEAPLYAAIARGQLADEGLELDISYPEGGSSGSDGAGAELVDSGRADFAILNLNRFGLARARGADLVAVAAIVQRPLTAVIAAGPEPAETPAQLEGEKVAVIPDPSGDAILDSVLADANLPPDAVERTGVGPGIVPSLESGRVAAATGSWDIDSPELRASGVSVEEFRIDEYGAPRYPGLVLVTRGNRAPDDRDLTCRLLRGIGPAYSSLDNDPQSIVEDMLTELPDLDEDSQEAQFAELIAADSFATGENQPSSPALDKGSVSDWIEWAAEFGVVSRDAADQLPDAFQQGLVRSCSLDRPAGGEQA